VDSELEVIHHEMEEKRASLAEKLDTLENHVLGTVQEATSAVSHTVEDVKSVVDTVTDSVKGTVESVAETVKHTFDMRDHVRRHPWGMFCGAVAVGFVGGRMIAPAQSGSVQPTSAAPPPATPPAPAPRPAARQREEEPQSGMNELLQRVKGLALGALMKVVRDMLSESLPETMKADVMTVVDDFTTKLGGKPVPTDSSSESNGAGSSASGEQSHEDQPQSGAEQPRSTAGERSQSGKKGQSAGGRFDRRNPPPRR